MLDISLANSIHREPSIMLDKHTAYLDVRQNVITVLRHLKTPVPVLLVSLVYLERAKDTALSQNGDLAAERLLFGAVGLAYRVSANIISPSTVQLTL